MYIDIAVFGPGQQSLRDSESPKAEIPDMQRYFPVEYGLFLLCGGFLLKFIDGEFCVFF
jgi:hypothetical protein